MRREARGSRMATRRLAPVAGLVFMAGVGAARAQVCESAAATQTTCGMVLTQPQRFTVRATWTPPARSPRATDLSLTVNGRTCAYGRAGGWFGGGRACRLVLPAGLTVIQATTDQPGRTEVRVTPSDRLSALPREAKDLDPRKSLLARLFWP